MEQGWVRLDIGDAGPGIPHDVLEKIFTPFFTTKARGTGLGLAVVRKVVDRHNGRVDVETAPGAGTTFKIYLPLATKVPPVQRGAAAKPIVGQPPALRPPGRADTEAPPRTAVRYVVAPQPAQPPKGAGPGVGNA
ncbi:MAG: ATP-binding protein [Elusimicrobiota bacterium]